MFLSGSLPGRAVAPPTTTTTTGQAAGSQDTLQLSPLCLEECYRHMYFSYSGTFPG